MVETVSPRFWLLQWPPYQEEGELQTAYETLFCPTHAGHRRVGKLVSEPSFSIPRSALKDFTWIWDGYLLISQNLLQIFERHRVTGFEAKAANVAYSNTANMAPPALFELVITGWGGLAAQAAGVTLVESCQACGHKVYAIAEPGLLIDADAWDGSDLFLAWPLPGYRFASDRLASILREEKVSGIELIPASQISMKKGGKASPGSLDKFMPESRVRELEQRFGVSSWLVKASRWRFLEW